MGTSLFLPHIHSASDFGRKLDRERQHIISFGDPRKVQKLHRNLVWHPPSRRANNRGLPTELLLLIFENVYADNRLNGEWIQCSPQSPTQFPFALAAVCKTWRDVLGSVPRFWTRLIINLDTTKLSDVDRYLCLSRELAFEITVTRDQQTIFHSRANNDEGVRAAVVMTQILPHLHRCRSLCFQLLRSSSLPALRHLNVYAPLLERLRLQCGIDDGEHPLVGSEVPGQWNFSAPALRSLFLNGRNFRDACALHWVETLGSLEDLCVSRYSGGKYPTGELHLHDVLRVVDGLHRHFRRLQMLTLQDISFDVILARQDGYDIQIEAMKLHSLGPSTVRTIFESKTGPAPRLVHLKHTPLSNIRLTQTDTLVLEGPFSFIAGSISIWDGVCLSIKDCPSFDDHTIRHIHQAWNPDKLTSPSWSRLEIDNCTEFSADTLLDLINAREDVVRRAREKDPNSQLIINSLRVLQVHGGPPISAKTAMQLKQKLDIFEWHEAATGIRH
ncbi:hypothetical protein AZE42_05877 [Rhizopogon vesiculosus]|uniref:Uncharacterized protein n=1 Tax=Rhizopogon vesiculosus TaxID=180088 RepID=A0A1J8QCA0_9AGAM|nr:hypothetical protein AZE42_05877 [Rhizopogon vesiculosus]